MSDIAGTTHKAEVTIKDICAAMKNPCGFDLTYGETVEMLRQFRTEIFAQIGSRVFVHSRLPIKTKEK